MMTLEVNQSAMVTITRKLELFRSGITINDELTASADAGLGATQANEPNCASWHPYPTSGCATILKDATSVSMGRDKCTDFAGSTANTDEYAASASINTYAMSASSVEEGGICQYGRIRSECTGGGEGSLELYRCLGQPYNHDQHTACLVMPRPT